MHQREPQVRVSSSVLYEGLIARMTNDTEQAQVASPRRVQRSEKTIQAHQIMAATCVLGFIELLGTKRDALREARRASSSSGGKDASTARA